MASHRTLPAETTSFVGRADLLAILAQTFAEGARLVTLIGPPGMGKSRLGLRFAAQCLEAGLYPDGVVACDLVDAAGPADLCAVLGRAIDLVTSREAHGGD